MNKKPPVYLQTDPKWKDIRLDCNGGTMSIGGGGCGPTSAAMLIELVTGKKCTPVDAMRWCCQNGYVYANQGTSYDAFKPLFAEYGIDCGMIPTVCLSTESPVRGIVEDMLKRGYSFIVLMKKGNWTKNGHYIVVYWAAGKIFINDPASLRPDRVNGKPEDFWSTAKYFWWVDTRSVNVPKNESEDEDMTGEDIFNRLNEYLKTKPIPTWARKEYQEAIDMGITDGSAPMQLIPAYRASIMCKRAVEKALKDI